jgi:betaine-aldehyde dehydrogenase
VDKAVAAARTAFATWSQTPPAERADLLQRTHEAIVAKTDELAALLSKDMGMPLAWAKVVQVGLPTFNFAHFAELARTFDFDGREVGNSLIVREPVGVVGCITPWNFPLHQIVLKVGAALAAGCTVVLKPTEVAPLAAYALAEVFTEVGLPPGVFNLVSGYGPVVGEAIVAHPDVDMISFTGSTRAGKRSPRSRPARSSGWRSSSAASRPTSSSTTPTSRRPSPTASASATSTPGRPARRSPACWCPADRLEEAEAIAAETAKAFTHGDPNDPSMMLGPLVSAAQLERVRGYIEKGIAEGAKLVTGGVDSGHDTGYYVPATVFSGVTPDMTIAREEIFGPVLSIMPYSDEDDAVRIANDTEYGLAGGVWSGDPDRALRVAKRLRTGQVEINGGAFNPAAPFGGYKQSGVGREGGTFGLEEFLETKAIQR